jgi:hypothetical protein
MTVFCFKGLAFWNNLNSFIKPRSSFLEADTITTVPRNKGFKIKVYSMHPPTVKQADSLHRYLWQKRSCQLWIKLIWNSEKPLHRGVFNFRSLLEWGLSCFVRIGLFVFCSNRAFRVLFEWGFSCFVRMAQFVFCSNGTIRVLFEWHYLCFVWMGLFDFGSNGAFSFLPNFVFVCF